jgi:hypothetical protein
MRAQRMLIAALAALALAGLAGCGEDKPVIYKQGKYQGKPVAQPWDSPEFGGDRAKWERAIEARTSNQNEYSRMGNRPGGS